MFRLSPARSKAHTGSSSATPGSFPPLCTLAAQCLKGEINPFGLGWCHTDCGVCGKKMWRQRCTSTRDTCGDGVSEPCRLPTVCSNVCLRKQASQSAVVDVAIEQVALVHRRRRQPPASLLDSLGVDAQTYQLLQQLQQRDITPEDYELLMQLYAKPNTKTLDEQALAKVSTTFVARDEWASDQQCSVTPTAPQPSPTCSRISQTLGSTHSPRCSVPFPRLALSTTGVYVCNGSGRGNLSAVVLRRAHLPLALYSRVAHQVVPLLPNRSGGPFCPVPIGMSSANAKATRDHWRASRWVGCVSVIID
jgi:hypothetical protein